MKTSTAIAGIIVGLMAMTMMLEQSYAAEQQESRTQIKKVVTGAKSKLHQAKRGGIVYKTYCVLCHGADGSGKVRMTRLHGELQLEISIKSVEYYEQIIRGGGEAVGMSEFMPTWEDELSDEQISDVIVYLSLVTDPVRRGEVVFKTNCILCHGVKGNGKGRAAILYDPPPADLTRSDKNDDYKRQIITMGGAAMGRSGVMPIWGEQLEAEEIEDVVAYIRTLVISPSR